jgi:hypothetical protein
MRSELAGSISSAVGVAKRLLPFISSTADPSELFAEYVLAPETLQDHDVKLVACELKTNHPPDDEVSPVVSSTSVPDNVCQFWTAGTFTKLYVMISPRAACGAAINMPPHSRQQRMIPDRIAITAPNRKTKLFSSSVNPPSHNRRTNTSRPLPVSHPHSGTRAKILLSIGAKQRNSTHNANAACRRRRRIAAPNAVSPPARSMA